MLLRIHDDGPNAAAPCYSWCRFLNLTAQPTTTWMRQMLLSSRKETKRCGWSVLFSFLLSFSSYVFRERQKKKCPKGSCDNSSPISEISTRGHHQNGVFFLFSELVDISCGALFWALLFFIKLKVQKLFTCSAV